MIPRRLTGTALRCFPAKGYHFLSVDGLAGREVFCHENELVAEALKPGDRVEFHMGITRSGRRQAVDVRVIPKGVSILPARAIRKPRPPMMRGLATPERFATP